MNTGTLCEYHHQGRGVQVKWKGPLEPHEFEQVMQYYKWLWDLIRQGGLASYSYRMAHTRWHLSFGGSPVKGAFEKPQDATRFFYRYSKPQVFLAADSEHLYAMRQAISTNDGPPHQVELVTDENGLVNNRMYYFAQLDGTTPKGKRAHAWWPGHVYFDYRKFLQDHGQWTMDCSVLRENELDRKKKMAGRKYAY